MPDNDLITGLYSTAFRAFLSNFLKMIILAIGLSILETIGLYSNFKLNLTFAPVLIHISAAFLIQQSVISRNLKPWYNISLQPDTYIGFVTRSAVLCAIILAASYLLLITPSIFKIKGEVADGLEIAAMIFGGPILLGVFLSLFGLVLPATIAKGNNSIRRGYTDGRNFFWFTFGRLLVGPALSALGYIWIRDFLYTLEVPLNVYSGDKTFSTLGMVCASALYLVTLYITALAATVLCKTYLRAEQRSKATPNAELS
ncbi:MAG: hypothetical protein JKY31_05795 [Rhodobacteraceae bacterium]|nr:hypothetical protein [Paracoccaceae bacterium]